MTPRVAVIGYGYWGKNLVRNLAALQSLVAVCDSDPEALAPLAVQYPGVRTEADVRRVLEDPEIDAVVVATPAARHFEHARSALSAGKDVFVEKPLALRYAEGRELVRAAAAEERVLMVGHILEYHPAVAALKSLTERGDLGKLWYVYSNRLNLGKVRREENILWSFAPHDISVILGLAGEEPSEVRCVGSVYLQQGVFDVTTTHLRFDSGIHAHVFVSWLHPFKEQKLVVVGERKMAVFDDTVVEGQLRLYDKGIEWQAGSPVPRETSETTLYLDATEPLARECEHFLQCVRDRAVPRTDGVNGLRVLRVLEACQLSLENGGRPVPLSEIDGEAR